MTNVAFLIAGWAAWRLADRRSALDGDRLLAAVMIVAAGGCTRLMERRLLGRLQGKPAPDFELTSLDGDKVKLSKLEGRPVVLAFWAYG